MGRKSSNTVSAMMDAELLNWIVEPIVCDRCEQVCWSLQGVAHGSVVGIPYSSTIAWAEHKPLAQVLAVMAKTIGSQLGRIRERETAILVQETNMSLFDGL